MRYTSYQFPFFKFIHDTFGHNTVILLKQWINYNKELIRTTLRNKYLLNCKRSNIVPKHLNNYYRCNITFYNDTITQQALNNSKRFINNMLNLEITDNFKKRRILISLLYKVTRNIENNLPGYICQKFYKTQEYTLRKLFKQEEDRLLKKFKTMQTFKENIEHKKKNSNNIKYYCSTHSLNNSTVHKFSFNKHEFSFNDMVYDIEIKQSDYNFTTDNSLEPREKWFINTSNSFIPKEVISLLQLGEDFCLPPTNSSDSITQCVKHIENNFSRLQGYNCKNNLRNQIFPFINNLNKIDIIKNETEIKLIAAKKITSRFIKNNPDILFTRADKGNTVVALDRIEYISRMEDSLSDTNTYTILQRSPVNKLLNNLKELLKRWQNSKYISIQTHNHINSSNPILPRAYGLPKIHKKGHPLRIIVSSSGSPLHNLATYLQKILQVSLPTASSHIDNSLDLIHKLESLYIPHNCILVSLDVISLFTNVPIELVIDILEEKWSFIEKHSTIPKGEFFNAINLVLHSTFFTFNKKFYKQTYGTPMGSPLSPIIADLVLQKLETDVLRNLPAKPIFYFRFVDDIALSTTHTSLNDLLSKFNSYHPRLKFTLEIGGNTLNFLDLSIIKKDGYLIFDWFQKPTFSGRYLNYLSQHPFTHKKGTIISLIDRVILLSHPQFHKKNFDFIIKILMDNGYPSDLIFKTIRERLFYRFNHQKSKKHSSSNIDHNSSKIIYFTIPYISSIAKKFIQKFKNISFCKLAFTCFNKLSKFIKVHKDDASYVGQTKRMLNTRISEHRNHIKRNSSQTSVITDHRLEFDHDFDWDNVEVLDEEINYNKRLISEMIHIKKQKHGLNLKKDTDLLHPIYDELFDGSSQI